MLNNVVLMGNLVRDPELRKTKDGKSVASFRIANNDSYSRDGQEKSSIFIDVTIFGNRADTVAQHKRKGDTVIVIGRLSQRKYLSQKTNTEVTVTEIIANSVEFVSSKGDRTLEDSGFQSDIPTSQSASFPSAPVDTGYGDSRSESGNTSGIDVIDDDLPF